MKDIVRLDNPNEIKGFTRNLLRTDAFRRSPWIDELIEDFAQRPRLFFHYTWPDIEWSHFTTWMNAVAIREYENPTISDLYLLHELRHAATLEYDPEVGFAAWYRKMTTNEYRASLDSEVFVYFRIPGLRQDSFPFAIWADRFLGQELGPELEQHIASERVRAMRDPDPFDFSEQQIASYARQNFRWANVWRENWQEVERACAHLVSTRDLEPHVAWLRSRMIKTRSFRSEMPHEVPFPAEAVTFAEIVAENRKVAGNPSQGQV